MTNPGEKRRQSSDGSQLGCPRGTKWRRVQDVDDGSGEFTRTYDVQAPETEAPLPRQAVQDRSSFFAITLNPTPITLDLARADNAAATTEFCKPNGAPGPSDGRSLTFLDTGKQNFITTDTETSLEQLIQRSGQLENASIVCFGMITEIHGRCDINPDLGSRFDVKVVASDKFEAVSAISVRGKIKSDHGFVIQALLDDPSITIYGVCVMDQELPKQKVSRGPRTVSCTLAMTLYGPWEMFEDIGEWAQEVPIFLQDPLFCHQNVMYCNPHKLSFLDSDHFPMLSDVVSRGGKPLHMQELPQLPDILGFINSSHGDLEEATTPSAITTSLKRHQKQALTFMRRREAGWAFGGEVRDMWELIEGEEQPVFLNRVSNHHQAEAPPDFHGGIVADPMGLGKTLTMIALIAADLEESLDYMDTEGNGPTTLATLVVVPPPLLDTWENELACHTLEGALTCRRHHAKTRLLGQGDLQGINMVLTTYHTISAEWKPNRQLQNSILFSTKWRRIVLDEAHFIRNGSSQMARAVCSLDGLSRWAVTGTPIQNRLTDLASLLHFIRAFPYTDPKRFDADISHLWKDGRENEAVSRLALLSSCLLLRRPPATISLPTRRDMSCSIEFKDSERKLYLQASQQIIVKIDEALNQGSELSRSSFYVNVLQQIESLRLICDLGIHYHARKGPEPMGVDSAPKSNENWGAQAQQVFNVERDLGNMVCLQCDEILESTEGALDDPFANQRPAALFFGCLRYICAECADRLESKGQIPVCGHPTRCPSAQVSVSGSAREDIPDTVMSGPDTLAASSPPSKVEALIVDIKQLPVGTKSVVFSTWRMTLDVVEKALRQANIESVRFDGRVPQKDRKAVVDKFKRDPTVTVMLLTLSCGAVGLTLTVASRAYLMEPHWNPTLEDQALARIHRIGQTKEVTTVRFYIRDSFEEEIIKLQEKKKQLAGVLLSPHDGGNTSGSLGRLHELRRLL